MTIVRRTYENSFLRGLGQVGDPRLLLESFVRAALDDLSAKVSRLLAERVVFAWGGRVLSVQCPVTGEGRDVAVMRISSVGGVETLDVSCATGGGTDRHWSASSREEVGEVLAGLVGCPAVAWAVAEACGGLRVGTLAALRPAGEGVSGRG
jgi:hypothetical protein